MTLRKGFLGILCCYVFSLIVLMLVGLTSTPSDVLADNGGGGPLPPEDPPDDTTDTPGESIVIGGDEPAQTDSTTSMWKILF